MEGRGEMAFLAGWTTKVGSAAFCVRPFHIAIFLLCFVSDFFTSLTTSGISVWLAWVTSNFLLFSMMHLKIRPFQGAEWLWEEQREDYRLFVFGGFFSYFGSGSVLCSTS